MRKLRFAGIVFSALLLVPTVARAGQKSHNSDIPDEVIVIQAGSGQELHGRLLELSSTSLAILVDGGRVDVPVEDVLRIDSRHDSVKDGAIIGGAIAGGLLALTCRDFEGGASACVAATVIDGGFGALIGAGIDALHKGRTPIYIKPAGQSRSALQVKIRF